MIVVTGALGFIGSCLVKKLNDEGLSALILIDDLSQEHKMGNLQGKKFEGLVDRTEGIAWIHEHHHEIDHIFHLGARTDTTETDQRIFDELNLRYSKDIWQACTLFEIPLIYASSAATYGLGELGYVDDHGLVPNLQPLNAYGESKNDFDKWALLQVTQPPNWFGLKFFNVFGPNEYHKGRMASVVYHTFKQIRETGAMRLFRSHRSDFKDGEQMRDFIYVKDVIDICFFLHNEKPQNGLYNVGTGQARTFWDLANCTFKALGKETKINFINTPEDIRENYQYFTEAKMDKLVSAGYRRTFTSLDDAILDYVKHYLNEDMAHY